MQRMGHQWEIANAKKGASMGLVTGRNPWQGNEEYIQSHENGVALPVYTAVYRLQ